MLDSTLEKVQSDDNAFDVDLCLFHKTGGKRRCWSFQPNRIDVVDGKTFATGGKKKLGITPVTAADRFHSRAAQSGCAQQTQELHDSMSLADACIGAGNEKAHATCWARSD